MFTDYTVLANTLGEIDNKQVLKYHHFRSACYSFINLLDINLSDGFSCGLCGAAPMYKDLRMEDKF